MPQGKIWPHPSPGFQMLGDDVLGTQFSEITDASTIFDGLLDTAIFNLPLLVNALPTVANDFTVTYPAAASVRTVVDHEGTIRRVNSGELRFEGARRVENLSDFTDVGDMAQNVVGTGGTYVDNADGTVTLGTPSAADRSYVTIQSLPLVVGGRYMLSFEIVDVTGIAGTIVDYTNNMFHITGGPTVSWEGNTRYFQSTSYRGRVAWPFECTSGGTANLRVGLGVQAGVATGGAEITIKDLQVEEISGQTIVAPGDYIEAETDYDVGSSVTGVKYYATTLGNTWNGTSFEVTEGDGSAISDLTGWLCEHSVPNDFPLVDFSAAGWVATAASKGGTLRASPDGREDSVEVIEDTATSQHYLSDAVTHTGGELVTVSCYFKRGVGSRDFSMRIAWSAGTAVCIFDPDDLSADTTGSTATNIATEFTDVGNGWYRAALTAQEAGTDTSAVISFRLYDGASVSYTGDGASSLYMWGPQFEAGGYSSSYIPFSGTRAADFNLGYDISNILNDVGSIEAYMTQGQGEDEPFLTTTNYMIRGGAATARFCYRTSGDKDAFYIYDGTTAHNVAIDWARHEDIIYRMRWDKDESGGTMQHAAFSATEDWSKKALPSGFDGNFSFGSVLELNYSIQYPSRMKNIKIYDTNKGEAWLTS